jgi:hypothetical protein
MAMLSGAAPDAKEAVGLDLSLIRGGSSFFCVVVDVVVVVVVVVAESLIKILQYCIRKFHHASCFSSRSRQHIASFFSGRHVGLQPFSRHWKIFYQ